MNVVTEVINSRHLPHEYVMRARKVKKMLQWIMGLSVGALALALVLLIWTVVWLARPLARKADQERLRRKD